MRPTGLSSMSSKNLTTSILIRSSTNLRCTWGPFDKISLGSNFRAKMKMGKTWEELFRLFLCVTTRRISTVSEEAFAFVFGQKKIKGIKKG
jgi:hypothetical protein